MILAIIDDLSEDLAKAAGLIQRYFLEFHADLATQIETFRSAEEFLAVFQRDVYDILFIDFYLKGRTGLELAREIRKCDANAVLIFMTVSRDYAIDCYKVKAGGYLVKPFTYEELTETMAVINLKRIHDREYIRLNNGTEWVRLLLRDIIYCDICGHYTQIHTINAGIKRFRMSFTQLVQILEPYPEFLFCFRGCIVNMNKVARIDSLNFHMSNGERVPFRKKKQDEIMQAYSDFLFEQMREDI